MSKEQTPITAEEFLKGKSIEDGSNHNWKDPSNDPRTSDLMEQYAQVKVEEEVEKLRDELHEEEAKKVEHSLTTLLRMNEDLLNQLKNTVTLEELEEEVVKAYEEGIENALTHDSYIGQVIGIDYYKKQVKPKYE